MIYKVEVTETLQRVVEVEADSMSEAIDLVVDKCNEGTIELAAEDFVCRDIDLFDLQEIAHED